MRVDWQQELEGYSLRQIRDALRRLRFINTEFKPGLFSEHLPGRPSAKTAKRILDGLIHSGLARVSEKDARWFQLTDTGISLRAAHASKRFSRARAEKAVAKLLETVDYINQHPAFCHDVATVAVYGSYITNAPDLGDIDVAVELYGRWTPGAKHSGKQSEMDAMKERFERTFPPPDSFYDKGWWRFWPETYTMRLLRTDPGIKIIELQELELIGCPCRFIYPLVADVPAEPSWSFKREQVVL